MSVSVRLLVFSGRPDPEWDLEDAEVEELRSRLEAARESDQTNSEPPARLGYRGFLIRSDAGELPAALTVFKGTIRRGSGKLAVVLTDGAELEDWLLDRAREAGHGDVVERLGLTHG